MNRSLRLYVIAVISAVALWIPTAVHAHSPCYDSQGRENGCLSIHSGPPGTVVETRDVSVLRVVFNLYDGRPEGGPKPSIFHPDLPIYTLREFTRAQEGTTFVIPDVPPGIYYVAIFDGGERGRHFTGAPFRVVAAAEPADVPIDPVGDDPQVIPVVALAAAAAFALGLGTGVFLNRRSRRPS